MVNWEGYDLPNSGQTFTGNLVARLSQEPSMYQGSDIYARFYYIKFTVPGMRNSVHICGDSNDPTNMDCQNGQYNPDANSDASHGFEVLKAGYHTGEGKYFMAIGCGLNYMYQTQRGDNNFLNTPPTFPKANYVSCSEPESYRLNGNGVPADSVYATAGNLNDKSGVTNINISQISGSGVGTTTYSGDMQR